MGYDLGNSNNIVLGDNYKQLSLCSLMLADSFLLAQYKLAI
ncbi:15653_t:CDS:1, partial [Racocetra persica]